MLVVLVHVRVKPESIEAFKAATLENARHSLREAGIARFDVLQDNEYPDRFLLFEGYRSDDAPARHKETAHYLKWRDTVESMMAEPRRGVRYGALSPDGS
jgi:(4S)-4-hydroxy-5-phosphonooxypentane-2,3-dione isomerase